MCIHLPTGYQIQGLHKVDRFPPGEFLPQFNIQSLTRLRFRCCHRHNLLYSSLPHLLRWEHISLRRYHLRHPQGHRHTHLSPNKEVIFCLREFHHIFMQYTLQQCHKFGSWKDTSSSLPPRGTYHQLTFTRLSRYKQQSLNFISFIKVLSCRVNNLTVRKLYILAKSQAFYRRLQYMLYNHHWSGQNMQHILVLMLYKLLHRYHPSHNIHHCKYIPQYYQRKHYYRSSSYSESSKNRFILLSSPSKPNRRQVRYLSCSILCDR